MRSIALLLHPYFNLVGNRQVPLNFVSFDTLHPKEDITINVICERNDFDRRSNSRQNRYYIYHIINMHTVMYFNNLLRHHP